MLAIPTLNVGVSFEIMVLKENHELIHLPRDEKNMHDHEEVDHCLSKDLYMSRTTPRHQAYQHSEYLKTNEGKEEEIANGKTHKRIG
jgi:hypothetical protein